MVPQGLMEQHARHVPLRRQLARQKIDPALVEKALRLALRAARLLRQVTAPAAPGLRVNSAVAITGNIEPNTSAPCIAKPRRDGSLPKSISPLSKLPVI